MYHRISIHKLQLPFDEEALSHSQRLNKSSAKLLTHRTYGRYLKLSKSGNAKIDKAKLRTEAKLDGKYILSTNEFSLAPGEIAQGYKDLSKIEATFQSMKHVLDIRPVNHTKKQRIRAHVGICVLAYLLSTHAEKMCLMSWRKMRSLLSGLHAGCISSPQGTFIKTTESRRVVKNPNIVAVRFIGPFNKAGFINETSTKNHFITSLLAKNKEVS